MIEPAHPPAHLPAHAPARSPPEEEPIARRLIAARLLTLIKILYQSAAPAYRSATRLPDFEWRVMMQAGEHGPVVLTALATLLHQDKGQVSHAVKNLVRAKLLSREHLRAPIVLTKRGRAIFDRIVRIGRSRNAVLMRDLTEAERRHLPPLLAKLRANARALLEHERALRLPAEDAEVDDAADPYDEAAIAAAQAASAAPAARRRRTGAQNRLIAQDLFALSTLLQRSAALTFKRVTNLSDFEWRVLSQVGEHAPLTLIQLVPLLSRDKSQVGRTLTRLEERGLITRGKIGGGRHILVGISAQGRKVYAELAALALARNTALVAGLSAGDQQTLMSILDKLTVGANTLLARRDRPA